MQLTPVSALHRGDCIGIFSPSDRLAMDFPEQVHNGAGLLEKHGFKTQFARNYLAQDGIRAGTLTERLSDINELLDDPNVHALLASWGGKASNHLVNRLPYENFLKERKPLLGFSDITVLLNAVTAQTGLVTFHGPNNAGQLKQSDWSNLLCLSQDFPWTQTNLLAGAKSLDEAVVLRGGFAHGRLFGGNLNCFVLGVAMSKLDLSPFDGGIFFWEDLALTPRQIDQFLTALVNIGFMDNISGMVVGDFFAHESEEQLRSNPLDSVMNAVSNYSFPVIYAPSFGHKQLENPVFPIGSLASLDTSSFSLNVEEPILAE